MKYEYRVTARKRQYSWDAPFYYVERRIPGGTWWPIPDLTQKDKEEVSCCYQRKYSADDAIICAKRLERKHLKWDKNHVSVTVAFPAVGDAGCFLYVNNAHGWWWSDDCLKVRLERYKDVKEHFRKNPCLVQSETAILDGNYDVVSYSGNGLTADLENPFLLTCD